MQVSEICLELPRLLRRGSFSVWHTAPGAAYLKLLYPNVQHPEDISSHEFNMYCLKPAIVMRSIIKIQLGIFDPDEFGGKTVPELSVKDIDE